MRPRQKVLKSGAPTGSCSVSRSSTWFIFRSIEIRVISFTKAIFTTHIMWESAPAAWWLSVLLSGSGCLKSTVDWHPRVRKTNFTAHWCALTALFYAMASLYLVPSWDSGICDFAHDVTRCRCLHIRPASWLQNYRAPVPAAGFWDFSWVF